MKDEIKEILNRLEYDKDDVYYIGYTNGVNIGNTLMSKDIKLLLDCITNLQEENEKLKLEIKNLTHIVANKIIEDYDIDTALKNQLNEERIKYINLGVVCNDYKSRNEKASWWLKEMLKQAKNEETKAIINGTLELLLQGDDKDE